MKSERQNKIIELITKNSIGTQEELAESAETGRFQRDAGDSFQGYPGTESYEDVHRWQKSEVCCLSGGQTAYERQIYPGLKGRVCRC